MNVKNLEEILVTMEEQKECEHDFYDNPSGLTPVGRFGGHCVNVYLCKKCELERCKESELQEALSHYDKKGMPKK